MVLSTKAKRDDLDLKVDLQYVKDNYYTREQISNIPVLFSCDSFLDDPFILTSTVQLIPISNIRISNPYITINSDNTTIKILDSGYYKVTVSVYLEYGNSTADKLQFNFRVNGTTQRYQKPYIPLLEHNGQWIVEEVLPIASSNLLTVGLSTNITDLKLISEGSLPAQTVTLVKLKDL